MVRHRDRDPRRPRGGLIGGGVRGIAAGIGLASESIQAHRHGKAEQRESGSTPPPDVTVGDGIRHRDVDVFDGPPPAYSESMDSNNVHDRYPDEKAGHGRNSIEKSDLARNVEEKDGHFDQGEEDLEEEWNLDDAQDEVMGKTCEKYSIDAPGELEDTFLRSFASPKKAMPPSSGKLALPVVLPQRRPKDRSRGFIRAYAPVLENCGIDQGTWLAFLDAFQRSSAADPWLSAINLAAFATIALPVGIGFAVEYAIRQVTKIAIETQGRQR